MFTGIIEEIGAVVAVDDRHQTQRLTIRAQHVTTDLAVGSSIAVDGVCLTVVDITGRNFRVDIGVETLRRTALGRLSSGVLVNLERPLRMDSRLGGHLVQGHVDAVGTIASMEPEATTVWMEVTVPDSLLVYIAEKGSIALDGVSLTVARHTSAEFAVSLIPYTLEATTLGRKRPGDLVNIEVDILAKYVQRLLKAHLDATGRSHGEALHRD